MSMGDKTAKAIAIVRFMRTQPNVDDMSAEETLELVESVANLL